MASRKVENRILKRYGYHQGTKEEDTERVPCESCSKQVRGTSSWWKATGLTGDCYCRPCAMKRVWRGSPPKIRARSMSTNFPSEWEMSNLLGEVCAHRNITIERLAAELNDPCLLSVVERVRVIRTWLHIVTNSRLGYDPGREEAFEKVTEAITHLEAADTALHDVAVIVNALRDKGTI